LSAIAMTAVQTLTVTKGESELRLDRWFKRRFPTLGHGRLEKLLRTGQIRVDGRRAKASAERAHSTARHRSASSEAETGDRRRGCSRTAPSRALQG
jgi:23S rRNA-/tRNA-specific pseudouridylate synthase